MEMSVVAVIALPPAAGAVPSGAGKDGKGAKGDGKGDGKGMSDAERSRIHGWGRGKGSFANGKFGGENCSCEHCLRGMAAWAALHPGRSVGP